jgi:Flp pilus assembly protein TadD
VRAEQALRRALELNPNHAMAHFFLAHTLSNSYRHDEALALIRKGQDLDPLSPLMYSFHAQFLFDARRYAEALEPARRAVTMAPAFFHGHEILSRLHLQRGALDEAFVECEKSHELSGGMLFALARMGYIHANAGRRADAEAILARLGAMAANRFVAPSHTALVHAGLSERERALTLLEAAFEQHAVPLVLISTDPVWDEYRQEPRFRSLMQKYGFPERPLTRP